MNASVRDNLYDFIKNGSVELVSTKGVNNICVISVTVKEDCDSFFEYYENATLVSEKVMVKF